MFARELADGTVLMIEQEDHTNLAAQFAAHWGNEQFSRPEPYHSVLFGTIYHDSGHLRAVEVFPPRIRVNTART